MTSSGFFVGFGPLERLNKKDFYFYFSNEVSCSFMKDKEVSSALRHVYGCASPGATESKCAQTVLDGGTLRHVCFTEEGENLGDCNCNELPWVTHKVDDFMGMVPFGVI